MCPAWHDYGNPNNLFSLDFVVSACKHDRGSQRVVTDYLGSFHIKHSMLTVYLGEAAACLCTQHTSSVKNIKHNIESTAHGFNEHPRP